MKLSFADITSRPSSYILSEGTWTGALGEELAEPLARLTIHRQDQDTVVVKGSVSGIVKSRCGRCNDPVRIVLNADFRYLATTRIEEVLEEEIECSRDDLVTLFLNEPQLDLGEILREQLILAEPLRPLCSDGCQGICPACGINWNRAECSCNEKNSNSPFAVLETLKKNKDK